MKQNSTNRTRQIFNCQVYQGPLGEILQDWVKAMVANTISMRSFQQAIKLEISKLQIKGSTRNQMLAVAMQRQTEYDLSRELPSLQSHYLFFLTPIKRRDKSKVNIRVPPITMA